jgi:thiosulfate/3-mercaptopyruvate sulfurtransferase
MALMSVDELARRLDDPNLRVVDTRWYLLKPGSGRAAYHEGHIPGAVHLDLDSDLSAGAEHGSGRHPLPSPAAFRAAMEASGVGTDSVVVAYDDVSGAVAARLWWMLDNLGHRDIYVLDGGIQAWTAGGNALESEEPEPRPASAHLEVVDRWSRTIDREELVARLGNVVVLDGRAANRYRGEVEPIDPKAGHIPTALSAPTTGNLDAGGHFLAADDLRGRFAAFASHGETVVSSCGSGTTACQNILAMRLAGLPEPLLYVGSFSDWSSSGMPVMSGDSPGSMEEADR